MIILHVGNFDRKHHYRAMYNCDYKISNGLIRSGHAVYSFSDRDVSRDSNPFHLRKLGVSTANKKMLAICHMIRPSLIVLGHSDIIHNETLEKARALCPGVKIAYYNVDPLFVPSNHAAIHRRSGVVDSIYITTGGNEIQQYACPKTHVFFLPNPVDNSIETGRAFERSDQPSDIIFCTARSNAEDARAQFMLNLKSQLPEVVFDLRGIGNVPAVFGAAYLQVMSSAKMAVNLSKTCGGVGHSMQRNYLYSSDRLAQITGNGLLTFIDRSTGLDTLYTEEEIAFFKDKEELVEKIRYFKKNDAERRRIAENGWKKAHSAFNETLIARYMIETSFGEKLSHPYVWGTLSQRTNEAA